MKTIMLMTAAVGLALGAGAPAAAQNSGAQNSSQGKAAKTPSNWSYEIRNGQRVPKANRVVKTDGSWSEEVKQGNCTVTREGRDGEMREVRSCS